MLDITPQTPINNQSTKHLPYRKRRNRGQQFASILVRWLMQHLFSFAHLDELPATHHRNARCELRHDW
jgi:hypothetical protein